MLEELARGRDTIVCVKAGTQTLRILANVCTGRIWAVDDHIDSRNNPRLEYQDWCDYIAELGLLGSKIIPMVMNSSRATRYFPLGNVDMLYITGSDFQSTWQELTTWVGRLKHGGLVCGPTFPSGPALTPSLRAGLGGSQAVEEFHQSYQKVYGLGELAKGDGLWVIRRE